MSKFLSVQCPKCSAKQVVFGNATGQVNCSQCSEPLAYPTGGRVEVRGKILEVLS